MEHTKVNIRHLEIGERLINWIQKREPVNQVADAQHKGKNRKGTKDIICLKEKTEKPDHRL